MGLSLWDVSLRDREDGCDLLFEDMEKLVGVRYRGGKGVQESLDCGHPQVSSDQNLLEFLQEILIHV